MMLDVVPFALVTAPLFVWATYEVSPVALQLVKVWVIIAVISRLRETRPPDTTITQNAPMAPDASAPYSRRLCRDYVSRQGVVTTLRGPENIGWSALAIQKIRGSATSWDPGTR